MPTIFKPVDINSLEKEVQKDYFDRHSPLVICEGSTKEGEKFSIKVRVGNEFVHPDDGGHFISLIQLWDRETLLAEARMFPGSMGNKPGHAEIDFYIVPKVSMNLTALSYCTKHGLWQSEPKAVKVLHDNTECKNN